jgi:hypothetical protein
MVGRLPVGAVLKEAGEEQVPRLQGGEVLLVVDVRAGQEAGGLEVQQRRGDDDEARRLVEVESGGGPQVPDELVGDGGEGDLRDVQAVLGDEPQEQVERTGEDVEVDLEPGAVLVRCQATCPRATISRASLW